MKSALPLGMVFVAAIGLAAAGQEGKGKKAAPASSGAGIHLTIRNLDTDADGGVSKDEWMAVFNKLNANGDAAMNEVELNAGTAAYPCPGGAGVVKKKGEGK